jgi:uncharacterized protein YukE
VARPVDEETQQAIEETRERRKKLAEARGGKSRERYRNTSEQTTGEQTQENVEQTTPGQ